MTKFLLALDYGEVSGMEAMRDTLLSECDAEISLVAPKLGKGDPCGSFYRLISILARNAATENRVEAMFELLEERRKLHLRLYGKDADYLQDCETLAKLCEKYDLTEKAAHYRMITEWD